MSLKPWREVISPHPDVAAGRYQQAEFAADLAQVVSGKAEPEYQDPVEFFARTYLTDGMTHLLVVAAERLAGKGGEPVVQLKTAFGGGKTHTMLALYHLFGGKAQANQMLGADNILKQAKLKQLPDAHIAVIVGTALNPARTRKVNGITVRTLWGDIGAQLGGKEGYELMDDADKKGVAPGADDLVELFNRFGPAIILIDELIAYARNIYGKDDLAAGTFDSMMTFIQSLTEAAKRSKRSIVVAAIPESDIEIGGEGGKFALDRIENIFGRLEAIWKPVGALEGFEIVRRRLFATVQDPAARDETCRAFSRLYDENPADFPQECREGTYLERLRAAYPIHPELFDRLYEDWSSLEKFQRTRGVLRLMASVIHELWVRNDRSLVILPGMIPFDARRVRDEVLRYLPETWNAIVDKDVDGENSEPRSIDENNARFGAVSAARRVARTVFLGSAPSVRQQTVRGIEDVRVRLGVTQPEEQMAVFNDALGRLNDKLTYLYSGNRRFWFDTQPNLRRTMEDRAVKLESVQVEDEIIRRLRTIRERGDFKGVHVCLLSADIPDEQQARLVILSTSAGHRNNRADSPALAAATEILDKRGNSPRTYRNMLLFVAADAEQVTPLEQEVRRLIAWRSIVEDADTLNLDTHQKNEAQRGQERAEDSVGTRVNDAYCWLLVPTQEGTNPMTWEAIRIGGSQDNPVLKAAKRVRSDQLVIAKWSPTLLKMELDRWLWQEAQHVGLKRVWEVLTTYLYVPRLRDEDVLFDSVREGIRSRDFFGFATNVGLDGRYQGLQFGAAGGSIYLDDKSVLVKPEVAAKQMQSDAETAATARTTYLPEQQPGVPVRDPGAAQLPLTPPGVSTSTRPKRFHGSVTLDATRVTRDVGQIAQEVIQHLARLVGANVQVTLEIHATLPDGAPDNVVRTVNENCRTLRFTSQGFEEE